MFSFADSVLTGQDRHLTRRALARSTHSLVERNNHLSAPKIGAAGVILVRQHRIDQAFSVKLERKRQCALATSLKSNSRTGRTTSLRISRRPFAPRGKATTR